MSTNERRVRLFRDRSHQTILIPRDFELEGDKAIIRKEGNKLIVQTVKEKSLLNVLSTLQPLDEALPDVDEGLKL